MDEEELFYDGEEYSEDIDDTCKDDEDYDKGLDLGYYDDDDDE